MTRALARAGKSLARKPCRTLAAWRESAPPPPPPWTGAVPARRRAFPPRRPARLAPPSPRPRGPRRSARSGGSRTARPRARRTARSPRTPAPPPLPSRRGAWNRRPWSAVGPERPPASPRCATTRPPNRLPVQHQRPHAVARQLARGGQTGDTAADDHHVRMLARDFRHAQARWRSLPPVGVRGEARCQDRVGHHARRLAAAGPGPVAPGFSCNVSLRLFRSCSSVVPRMLRTRRASKRCFLSRC